ncbi:MAG: DnaJ C-terminal domain-containing protein [Myxococcota bacterium]
MANQDLYEVLGLQKGASDADIKRAYRKLARELHPDRNPDNPQAEERFKQVGHAYQILSDPEKRKLYDEFGEIGLREGFDPEAYRQYQRWQEAGAGGAGGGGFRVEDIFGGRAAGQGFRFNLDDLFGGFAGAGPGGGPEDIFGGFGRRKRRAPQRGPDLESEVTVDLPEALRGAEKELSFSVPGVSDGHRSLKVRIPAGVKDGDRIRLKGQGMASPAGGAPGNLVLTVRVRPHAHFWREGDDLHLTLPVTALEAFRGAKVPVPTPEGEVALTLPPGTQSGQRLRLRGKGAPSRTSRRGDLYAHVQVHLPPRDEGAEEVEKALEELSKRQPNPRGHLKL